MSEEPAPWWHRLDIYVSSSGHANDYKEMAFYQALFPQLMNARTVSVQTFQTINGQGCADRARSEGEGYHDVSRTQIVKEKLNSVGAR